MIFLCRVDAAIAELVAIHLDDAQDDGWKGGGIGTRCLARHEDGRVDRVRADDHHDARGVSSVLAR